MNRLYKGNEPLKYEHKIQTIAGYLGLTVVCILILVTSQGVII